MASGTELLSTSGGRVSSWGIWEGSTPAIKQHAVESLNKDFSNTYTLNWHKDVAANLAKNYFLQLLFNPLMTKA